MLSNDQRRKIRRRLIFPGVLGVMGIPAGLVYCVIIRNFEVPIGQVWAFSAITCVSVMVAALVSIVLTSLYRDSIDDQYADFGKYELQTRKAQIEQILEDMERRRKGEMGEDQWKKEE